jgi:hypothetical protein
MQSRDEAGGCPPIGQSVSGMQGGVSLVSGFYGERGKARADTVPDPRGGAGHERKRVEQQKL